MNESTSRDDEFREHNSSPSSSHMSNHASSHDSGFGTESGSAPSLPANLGDLVTMVHWLERRVCELEGIVARLQAGTGLSGLQKLEYKIQRLYVRELTGTLNIGITSIGDGTDITKPEFLEALQSTEAGALEGEGDDAWLYDESGFYTDR